MNIIVVVNGDNFPFCIDAMTVEELKHHVLVESKNTSRPESQWDLRRTDGSLMDGYPPTTRMKDFYFKENEKVFLSLKVAGCHTCSSSDACRVVKPSFEINEKPISLDEFNKKLHENLNPKIKCSGNWISGSGGHKEHEPCEKNATWIHPDDIWAYCDEHIKDFEKKQYVRYENGRTVAWYDYWFLEQKLIEQRDSGDTKLTEAEEDNLLDEMDSLWWKMTDEEIAEHNKIAAERAKKYEEERKSNAYAVKEYEKIAKLAGWDPNKTTELPWDYLKRLVRGGAVPIMT
jgi:hypothetical protein